MQNEELAKELAALFDRVNEPKPLPLPEQDTRVGEAMAGIADDRNRAEWTERVDRATAGILKLVPAILAALNTRPAPSGEEVDSGMSGEAVERAELLWANLPVQREWTTLPTHEKALVCHLVAALRAGDGR